MIRKRVLDLNGGLGGRAYAFQNSGFNIVEVIDNDKENCEILSKTIDSGKISNNNLLELEPNSLPDAEIIMAKYLQQTILANGKKISSKDYFNNIFIEIICQKMPYIFLLEVPESSINSSNEKDKLNEYVSNIRGLGYDISYEIYDEMNFSGYPVVGRQVYFVAKRNSIIGEFEFPKILYSKATNEIVNEKSGDIDNWYRSINFSTENWKKEQWYIKTLRNLSVANNIHMGSVRENYLVDSIGPRRFTHNELAKIKGLADINYNGCSNKRRMYNKIAYASNVYVVKAIASSINRFMEDNIIAKNILNSNTQKRKKKTKIEEKTEDTIFPKYKLKKISIEKLKGINNLELEFEKDLTAIMGVNGVGKSTILHALACTYAPFKEGDNRKFREFFTPNSDTTWNGSSFTVENYDGLKKICSLKKYEKKKDRWARYSTRPKRDVYYIGVDSCIPEIEKERSSSFIKYISKNANETNKHAEKIVETASYILQKDYEKLMIHETSKKNYIGVHTKGNITYSALSMGAGEQRVIKLLQTAYNANQYSMILIDELDLLLHADAFIKLIKKLSEIAKKRNLQVIFTTHALEMKDLEEYVDIKYLDYSGDKILVYNTIKPDLLYELSGKNDKLYSIYVEDKFAASIVNNIAKNLKMQRFINVIIVGSIENAFTVAAGKVLGREDLNKILIVTDGDKYTLDEDKKKRLKQVLSGTELEHETKVDQALSIITQFNLPKNTSPEKYIHSMLVATESDEECVICAKKITSTENNHDWIENIKDRIGIGDRVYDDIIETVAQNEEWENYVQNIKNWISKKNIEVQL